METQTQASPFEVDAEIDLPMARVQLVRLEHLGPEDNMFHREDERLAEPREPPSLAELAELCKMSVRQLTRGFRTSRGCSISDHLAQVRIDAAKRRLSSSQESIKIIATSLGFASQSSFTFAFRRATGSTPNEYRKRAGRARALAERRLK